MPAILSLVGASHDLTERLTSELREVEAVFEHQLQSDLPAVNRLCGLIERYRGKMLRPTLTLATGLAARAGHGDGFNLEPLSHNHRVIAAVGEMIHMATLVHDDVLDEADLRRRGPTVNYLHGNEAAVLLGDYLISNAFHLCSTLGRPEINEKIGAMTNTLCAGELLQLHHRDEWAIDEATYFEIIQRKTASLIAICCELGATESGASPDVVEALSHYGRQLGIAFQIQDDLLDLLGDPDVVGKSLGKDLEKGKLTLPLIMYLTQSQTALREQMLIQLSRPKSPERLQAIRALLEEAGAADRARSRATELVADAKTQLTRVPPSPVRDLLDAMADAVVQRAF